MRYTEQKTNHYIAFTLLAIVRDKGDLISLITSDVELLEVFYAHTISPICIAIVTEIVMCLFIGSFHPYMGLLAAALILSFSLYSSGAVDICGMLIPLLAFMSHPIIAIKHFTLSKKSK